MSDDDRYAQAMAFVNARVEAAHRAPGAIPTSDRHDGAIVSVAVDAFLTGVRGSDALAHEIQSIAECAAEVIERGGSPYGAIAGPMMVVALLGAKLGMEEL